MKRILLAYVVWDHEGGGGRAPDTGTDRQEGVAEGHQPQQVEHTHTEEMWCKHRPTHYAAYKKENQWYPYLWTLSNRKF